MANYYSSALFQLLELPCGAVLTNKSAKSAKALPCQFLAPLFNKRNGGYGGAITNRTFDDSVWPNTVACSNDTVGVDNKNALTNVVDVFDTPGADAQFIGSLNLNLDNLVLLRTTIEQSRDNAPAKWLGDFEMPQFETEFQL